MHLYARINILNGRAVRLPKGDIREAISLDSDPVGRAIGWVAKGADRLFVVDAINARIAKCRIVYPEAKERGRPRWAPSRSARQVRREHP